LSLAVITHHREDEQENPDANRDADPSTTDTPLPSTDDPSGENGDMEDKQRIRRSQPEE
jgi:hypothetical protein